LPPEENGHTRIWTILFASRPLEQHAFSKAARTVVLLSDAHPSQPGSRSHGGKTNLADRSYRYHRRG